MNIHTPTKPHFEFDNTYARDLEGFYAPWKAATVPEPRFLAFNHSLASELGLDAKSLETDVGASIFAGNTTPDGATPLVQAYAGHQFGGFTPQLGDGRALLLGELIDQKGNRRDLQLKGSGRTPFSRGGDGKAAVGPVLREYLMGEAMHALGIPTTRALAAVSTGESVLRETALPGAVLTRIAASHIRVGTFQFFAVRKDWAKIKQLADYVIDRHYPEARQDENPYLAMFKAVAEAQAKLVASWMHIGFIHGVMNTDNMSIAGETIDYGPCAFMDHYAPGTVFSSIDSQGRYAYANQPIIAQWNLTRFAETLLSVVEPDTERATELLTDAINTFPDTYLRHWLAGMRAKIGLTSEMDDDLELVNELLAALDGQSVDYTNIFRALAEAACANEAPAISMFNDASAFKPWLEKWRTRLAQEDEAKTDPLDRANTMNAVNPLYIPRNHKVEEALSAAVENDNLEPFKHLLEVVQQPFEERDGQQSFAGPAPESEVPYQTFCGT